jgi:hypothetical protein
VQRLYRLTVPGISIKSDFTAARRALLADFPNVDEVVATTAPTTLLVLYSGPDEADAWCKALLDLIATRQVRVMRRLLRWRGGRLGGGDSAA